MNAAGFMMGILLLATCSLGWSAHLRVETRLGTAEHAPLGCQASGRCWQPVHPRICGLEPGWGWRGMLFSVAKRQEAACNLYTGLERAFVGWNQDGDGAACCFRLPSAR